MKNFIFIALSLLVIGCGDINGGNLNLDDYTSMIY